MRRWGTFLMGMVAGGLLIFAALNYHIIRASDGMHLVPKIDASLAGAYVDIRQFGPRDWAQHGDIFLALANADRRDLMGTAADNAVRNGLDRLLGPPNDNR